MNTIYRVSVVLLGSILDLKIYGNLYWSGEQSLDSRHDEPFSWVGRATPQSNQSIKVRNQPSFLGQIITKAETLLPRHQIVNYHESDKLDKIFSLGKYSQNNIQYPAMECIFVPKLASFGRACTMSGLRGKIAISPNYSNILPKNKMSLTRHILSFLRY